MKKTSYYFHSIFDLPSLSNPMVLSFIGLFIALEIILGRIIKPFELPFVRITFGFLATAVGAALLGPVLGALSAGIGDVVGFFLFPSPGQPFFPGFTITAILSSLLYGLFFYRRKINLTRIIIATLTVTMLMDLLLNTYWLTILLGTPWLKLLYPWRLIKWAAFLPLQIFLLFALLKRPILRFGDRLR